MQQENRVCHAVLEQIKQGAAKKAGGWLWTTVVICIGIVLPWNLLDLQELHDSIQETACIR